MLITSLSLTGKISLQSLTFACQLSFSLYRFSQGRTGEVCLWDVTALDKGPVHRLAWGGLSFCKMAVSQTGVSLYVCVRECVCLFYVFVYLLQSKIKNGNYEERFA